MPPPLPPVIKRQRGGASAHPSEERAGVGARPPSRPDSKAPSPAAAAARDDEGWTGHVPLMSQQQDFRVVWAEGAAILPAPSAKLLDDQRSKSMLVQSLQSLPAAPAILAAGPSASDLLLDQILNEATFTVPPRPTPAAAAAAAAAPVAVAAAAKPGTEQATPRGNGPVSRTHVPGTATKTPGSGRRRQREMLNNLLDQVGLLSELGGMSDMEISPEMAPRPGRRATEAETEAVSEPESSDRDETVALEEPGPSACAPGPGQGEAEGAKSSLDAEQPSLGVQETPVLPSASAAATAPQEPPPPASTQPTAADATWTDDDFAALDIDQLLAEAATQGHHGSAPSFVPVVTPMRPSMEAAASFQTPLGPAAMREPPSSHFSGASTTTTAGHVLYSNPQHHTVRGAMPPPSFSGGGRTPPSGGLSMSAPGFSTATPLHPPRTFTHPPPSQHLHGPSPHNQHQHHQQMFPQPQGRVGVAQGGYSTSGQGSSYVPGAPAAGAYGAPPQQSLRMESGVGAGPGPGSRPNSRPVSREASPHGHGHGPFQGMPSAPPTAPHPFHPPQPWQPPPGAFNHHHNQHHQQQHHQQQFQGRQPAHAFPGPAPPPLAPLQLKGPAPMTQQHPSQAPRAPTQPLGSLHLSEHPPPGPATAHLQERFTVQEVHKVPQQYDPRGQECTLLRLLSADGRRVVSARLYSIWQDSGVEVGDVANVILCNMESARSAGFGPLSQSAAVPDEIIVDDHHNLFILHPDVLLSGTRVSTVQQCHRRPVIEEMLPSSGGPAALRGTMLHGLFEDLLTTDPAAEPEETAAAAAAQEARVDRIVQAHLTELYDVQLSEKDARGALASGVPSVESFKTRYLHPVDAPPRDPSRPMGGGGDVHTGPDKSLGRLEMAVREVVDIEEMIWAPRYGLKGQIDASLRADLYGHPPPPGAWYVFGIFFLVSSVSLPAHAL